MTTVSQGKTLNTIKYINSIYRNFRNLYTENLEIKKIYKSQNNEILKHSAIIYYIIYNYT